jgi:MFS family permease
VTTQQSGIETTTRSHEPAPARPILGGRFRYLWATFAFASVGDGLAYGAVPLLAVVVDPQPLAVSGVLAADSVPWLALALPAGALADRFERGRLMAIVNTARGLLLGLLAALIALGKLDLGLLIAFVLANGGARAVYYSASQATVPELVGTSSLARANGVLSGTEAATEHLAGPVIGTVGASGLSLFGFRTGRLEQRARRDRFGEGVRLLLRDRSLRLLVILISSLAALQGLAAGILVLIATRDWGVHTSAYGAFLAAGAVGNVPGALLADRIVRKLGSATTLILTAFVSGAAYLVMALARSWPLAGCAFALVGFAVGAGNVAANALRQRLTPARLMGRVGSAWRGIVWGAAPLGVLASGGLAVAGGLRLPLYVAGAAQCAVALVLAAPLIGSLVEGKHAAINRARPES